MKKFFSYLCLSFFVAGCKVEYEDVSAQEDFSGLVGSYITLRDLKIHGITESIKDPKIINGYHITLAPGLGGPEIVTKDTIEAGSVISITNVMKCSNCRASRLYFVVEIFLEDLDEGALVWLDDLSMFDHRQNRIMNPEFFSLVP